jgi:hypothetical protein
MNIDLVEITSKVQQAGILGLLIFALITRYRGWWVDGPTHQKVVEERDKLLTLALIGSMSHERTTGILERVATPNAPPLE